MASLDAFLLPIPSPSPSGVDLRNDARFHALERLLIPASRALRSQAPDSDPPVDWGEVLGQAEELAGEGRDLRLLVIVTRALAHTDGFAGVAEGLGLLVRTVEEFWETVHPELRDRPSPREAAVRRINALFQIENDEDGLLCDLHYLGFFAVRALGRITGADLAAGGTSRMTFLNELPAGLGEGEKSALAAQHEARVARVRTACRALAAEQPDRLAELTGGVAEARRQLGLLEDRLSARVAENGTGVSFVRLGRFLERMALALAQAEPTAQVAPLAAGGAIPAPEAQPVTEAAMQPVGAISSRQDVERALDRIIEFYERTEPASPIPLFAKRLRKMVPMTFLQIMEEVAPSGLKEVRNLAGAMDDKSRT